MDDELEAEVFYQTLITHMKLVSKLVPGVLNVSVKKGYFLLKPEAIVVGLLLLLLIAYSHSLDLWLRVVINKVQLALRARHISAKDCLQLKLGLRVVPDVLAPSGSGGHCKAACELQRDNVGVYAIQGRRAKMEDRFSVSVDDTVAIYGVFDGHGGETAADFVEKNLVKGLLNRIQQEVRNTKPLNWDLPKIISEEILAVDYKLLGIAKAARDVAGTTALVSVVHGYKLIVANVGDSRGVICDSKGMAIPLSFDHKPQQLKERKRIKDAGGMVTFNGVWRVAGILATSRAIGDYPLKERRFIIADPDVLTFDLRDLQPRFMILASDGLWDTFSNEEAVAFIASRLKEPLHGAKSITQQAFFRGSLDNITVIVVTFDKTMFANTNGKK